MTYRIKVEIDRGFDLAFVKRLPLRSLIEDVFKLTKSFFPDRKIRRYTKRSVQKHVPLSVLLVGIPISRGIKEKEDLQRLAE